MAFRVLLACGVVISIAACNPFGGGEFSCTTNDQCGAGGMCTNSFCSFMDPSCMSGYRYGELSGGLSNKCVGDEPNDGGVDSKLFMDAHLAQDGVYCYGTGFGAACFLAPPTGAVNLTPQTIMTDTSNMCSTTVMGNPAWCVITGADITVAAGTVNAIGGKPLVLVATNTITVTGTIDVSSKRGGQIGAGSVAVGNVLCDPGTVGGNNSGGAGGSFGSAGKVGGNAGGETAGAVMPTNVMRGGCPGQDGKTGTVGQKGLGGGVVYLAAGTMISVAGTINASGAGATPGVTGSAGGGGGGSGGLIGLDAPLVSMTGAFIFANGGGGAEGSGLTTMGMFGGESINGAAAQGGGGLSASGGDGGDGGTSAAAGAGQNGTNGGGGGGGGAGAIRLFQAASITGAGTVSPAAS